jgi:hypothetical protein
LIKEGDNFMDLRFCDILSSICCIKSLLRRSAKDPNKLSRAAGLFSVWVGVCVGGDNTTTSFDDDDGALLSVVMVLAAAIRSN